MTREEMIATVNGEIGRLEQIRGLLKQSHSERFTLPGERAVTRGGSKRVLSQEARGRIAQAQMRRWAEQRKREAAGVAEAK